MFSRGSKLYNILRLKCPRCQQGQFLESHPYRLSNLNRVKDSCPQCGLKYKIEPSFYYGSMYVSYALGVGLGIAIYIVIFLSGIQMSLLAIFGCIVAGLVVLMPWIGALSKSIWAHIFMSYDPQIAAEVQQKMSRS
ncbi:MAG: DUF983 domain-containing protein [Flavobacteriaceae bacterium]